MENRYRAQELSDSCAGVLNALGMRSDEAQEISDSLVRASMEGADSHGLSRMAIYAKRIREGRISAQPEIGIERDGAVLRIDGDNGPGQVVSLRALDAALPVVRELGIAGVSIRRSNHFGGAAYYCQRACREGIAMIATTNSPPGIAPWGGRSAYFGTNPIAFGFPRREEPHVIVDMSSSVVARGNIILAAKEGREIPEGWAMDEEGAVTTDAAEALKGSVLPLGGLEGGAKGSALAMAVEILSAVLTGAAFGPQVGNIYSDDAPPADVGHSFILIDVARWLPLDDYYSRMDRFFEEIKSIPLAKDVKEILYPGERRYRVYEERVKDGIPLSKETLAELEYLCREHKIVFPSPIGDV